MNRTHLTMRSSFRNTFVAIPESLGFQSRPFSICQAVAAAVLGLSALTVQAADTFIGLGPLPGGSLNSAAAGVSADGGVVVGLSLNNSNQYEAFRWTNGVMTGLGFLADGANSMANAVSADGNVVVGFTQKNSGHSEAFRWTNGTMTGLGFFGAGGSSFANAVSADGSVVVGYGDNSSGNSEAFRWTETGGMTGLGFIGTGTFSEAHGVSADGSVVVGVGFNSSNQTEAFRWTQAGGMSGLGFLGSGTWSQAYGVSADGGVVVGYGSNSSGNQEAFRWTQADGMTGLGFLGTGTWSLAKAVSADGSVVVGQSRNGSAHYDYEAFRWTQSGGMVSIADWLRAAGVSLPVGWFLDFATGVNRNGNVVVGRATDFSTIGGASVRAWLARVGEAGSGLLTDIPAFNTTVAEVGSRGVQVGAALPNLAMFGAHHRSLLDNGLTRTGDDGTCGWATADAGRNNLTNTRMELAEVGVCKDVGTARLGAGIGQVWTQQSLMLGGSARFDGQYLIAEGVNAFANGLQPSLTGYYGRFGGRFNRHYMNGAALDSSGASPNSRAYALRARLDWKNAADRGRFSFSPYTAYTVTNATLDGYTETGGGFPAQINASTWMTRDLRLGSAVTTALTPATDLRLSAEIAHRFDSNVGGVSGQVIGLWNFSLPGQRIKQTWTHFTADVDRRLSDKVALTVGINAASSGGDNSFGGTAGLRASF